MARAMLRALSMLARLRLLLACASLGGVMLVAVAARAQTTVGSAPTITASDQGLAPHRIVNGQDLGQSTRPMNQDPTGVNYSDCISDMTLRFTVVLAGFTGQAGVQVWATHTNDCTANATRGVQGGIPSCWQVNSGLPVSSLQQSANTQTFDVRVQNLVGPQNAIPNPALPVNEGPSACTAQTGFAPVQMDIWFVPVDSSGTYTGSGALDYSITTDLVGPPAPVGVQIFPGDTLFNVTWTPNPNADTAGYDVFIDPIPGQEALATDATVPSTTVTQTICDASASASSAVDAVASDASSEDADASDADASMATPPPASSADAGCYTRVVPSGTSATGGMVCPSAVLTGGIVIDSGITPVDDSSLTGDSGVSNGAGGISTIPSQFIINSNSGTGTTVSGLANDNYKIKGLQNGTTYTVVVAAVDGSGNVGPPSDEHCDFPAPVNDFWKIYRQDGGGAGGGFCALEAVGTPAGSSAALVSVGAAAVAFARRRRRRS